MARSWAVIPVALFLIATLGAANVATAQMGFARPGELPALDPSTRAAVVDSITAAIDSVYVLGEAAERIVAHLREQLASGAYDELTDPAELVRRLEADAQAINHDGHFGIRALPPADPAAAAADEEEDPEEIARRKRRYRAMNYGFAKTEILPGNVGYVKFDMFADTEADGEAARAAASAMNFVANTDALILDLRENGGGAASMIRFLAGYLFAERVHLINWDIRARGETVQSWSADHVPGARLGDVPVYVLTSSRTFSAAEEFTFDLQHLERATVVGDTTGGGGHTVAGYEFDFDDFRVGIRIPYGRAYDPKTNEGWEGVGVIPHIAVDSDQALLVAHENALEKGLEGEEDEDVRFGLTWALQELQAELEPMTLAPEQMAEYAGDFGPRQVFIEDGVLWYQREDRPRYRLEPIAADLFRVGDLGYFRLGFARDESGAIVKVVGHYDNGHTDENPRSEGTR
jgi:hypothetical protein